MAYEYPETHPRAGEVPDHETTTKSLLWSIRSVGRLNEHNVAGFAFSADREAYHCGAGYRFDSVQQESAGDEPYTEVANSAAITKPNQWQSIGGDSGVSQFRRTWVSSENSLLWVLSSFQYSGMGVQFFPPAMADPGSQFAIAVDGKIIEESCSGVMDHSANIYEITGEFGSSHGVYPCDLAVGVTIDAILALSPGPHVIEMMGYPKFSTSSSALDWAKYIYNRELILFEMCKATSL